MCNWLILNMFIPMLHNIYGYNLHSDSTLTSVLIVKLKISATTAKTACTILGMPSLIARFMGPTMGPSGADMTQVGPMLAPWTSLSGLYFMGSHCCQCRRYLPCFHTDSLWSWPRAQFANTEWLWSNHISANKSISICTTKLLKLFPR